MALLHLLKQLAWGDVPIYFVGIGQEEGYNSTGINACSEKGERVVVVEITHQLLLAHHKIGSYDVCQLFTSANLSNNEIKWFLFPVSQIAEQRKGIH